VGDSVSTPFSIGWFPIPLTTAPVSGILKGFDQLLNLVLDQVEEEPSGKASNHQSTLPLTSFTEFQQTPRQLGLAVVRGPTVTLISPAEGFEEIADPFAGN